MNALTYFLGIDRIPCVLKCQNAIPSIDGMTYWHFVRNTRALVM